MAIAASREKGQTFTNLHQNGVKWRKVQLKDEFLVDQNLESQPVSEENKDVQESPIPSRFLGPDRRGLWGHLHINWENSLCDIRGAIKTTSVKGKPCRMHWNDATDSKMEGRSSVEIIFLMYPPPKHLENHLHGRRGKKKVNTTIVKHPDIIHVWGCLPTRDLTSCLFCPETARNKDWNHSVFLYESRNNLVMISHAFTSSNLNKISSKNFFDWCSKKKKVESSFEKVAGETEANKLIRSKAKDDENGSPSVRIWSRRRCSDCGMELEKLY